MPIMTEKCYKIVCPICGVAYDNGDRVPLFFSKDDAHDFVEQNEGEPIGRAIARMCRIIGCGEKAWDIRHSKRKNGMKLTKEEKKALLELHRLAANWPQSLKIFARAGKLVVLKPGQGRTIREATVYESLKIPIDGGDPGENDKA